MIPYRLWKRLALETPWPFLQMSVWCRRGKVGKMKCRPLMVVAMQLDSFLECVRPEQIKGL
jgi:hypothetical protein